MQSTYLQLFLNECLGQGYTIAEVQKDLAAIFKVDESLVFDFFIPKSLQKKRRLALFLIMSKAMLSFFVYA